MTENHVVFTERFRKLALKKRLKGISPDQIFESAGFDAKDFRKRYFRLKMVKWVRKETRPVDKKSKPSKSRGRPKLEKNFETLENLTSEDLKSIILVQQEIINQIKKKSALAKKR